MKNILLLIHDDAGEESRFQAALDLARALSGHVTCLDIVEIPALIGTEYLTADAGVALLEDDLGRLAEAQGQFVIFLDQDDVWHPLQLERQVAWMMRDPACAAAVCPYHHWIASAGSFPEPASIWPADPGLVVIPEFTGWVYHQFLWDCWAQTSGTLLRRDVVQACGGYNTSLLYSEDWDLHLRISLREPFAALHWPPVLYRHHEVQGSRTVRSKDFRAELLLRFADQHGLASRDGRAMDARRFAGIIAASHYSFGYLHLRDGRRWVGVHALLAAWARYPIRWKYLMLALAGSVGWRPRRGD